MLLRLTCNPEILLCAVAQSEGTGGHSHAVHLSEDPSFSLMPSCSELQVIVLEDRPEYMRGLPSGKAKQMEREPFELRVICNPKLRAMDESGARFYEGCLSVPGYQVYFPENQNHRLA